MRSSQIVQIVVLAVLWTVAGAFAAEPPVDPTPSGEVTLTLTDYLDLRQRIERLEGEVVEPEPALAELVSQDTEIRVNDDVASISTTFELEVRGDSRKPLDLPLTGLAETAHVEPADGAALHRVGADRLTFVPRRSGSFRVTVEWAADLGPQR